MSSIILLLQKLPIFRFYSITLDSIDPKITFSRIIYIVDTFEYKTLWDILLDARVLMVLLKQA